MCLPGEPQALTLWEMSSSYLIHVRTSVHTDGQSHIHQMECGVYGGRWHAQIAHGPHHGADHLGGLNGMPQIE